MIPDLYLGNGCLGFQVEVWFRLYSLGPRGDLLRFRPLAVFQGCRWCGVFNVHCRNEPEEDYLDLYASKGVETTNDRCRCSIIVRMCFC